MSKDYEGVSIAERLNGAKIELASFDGNKVDGEEITMVLSDGKILILSAMSGNDERGFFSLEVF